MEHRCHSFVRSTSLPRDVESLSGQINVNAFSRSARTAASASERRQVEAANADSGSNTLVNLVDDGVEVSAAPPASQPAVDYP